MIAKTLTILATTLTMGGCATTGTGADYVPLVDARGASSEQMARDTADCQGYARTQMGAQSAAIGGAVAGALIGALFGAALGGGIGNELAVMGAVSGGMGAAGGAEMNQRSIISRCLAGRGYSVLN